MIQSNRRQEVIQPSSQNSPYYRIVSDWNFSNNNQEEQEGIRNEEKNKIEKKERKKKKGEKW